MLLYTFPGAYTPLTREGNIVVDGILASCYASTDHDTAHFVRSSLQWIPGLLEWMFDKETGSSNDLYISISKGFSNWVLPMSTHMESTSFH